MGDRGQRQAGGVGDRADRDHRRRAEAVGGRAGERLGHAPDKIVQRDRKREHGDRQRPIRRERREENTESLPDAERDRDHDRAGDQHERRVAPERTRRCHRFRLHRFLQTCDGQHVGVGRGLIKRVSLAPG